MTTPIANAQVYGDFAGLESLRKAARGNDPAAIRQVARQFESLFARMLIKSMRDAIGPDPIFGSDQEQTYQGMFDDQLSIELTRGHGLGLADMLVRQLQRRGTLEGNQGSGAASGATGATGGAGAAATAGAGGGAAPAPSSTDTGAAPATGPTHSRFMPAIGSPAARSTPRMGRLPAGAAPAMGSRAAGSTPAMGPPAGRSVPATGSPGAAAPPAASRAEQKSFIHDLWPQAREAGQQLGVAPESLVAQAALETDWGRSVPQDAAGRSSNNLFGIKAAQDWSGPSVSAGTHEFAGGAAHPITAQFRAYGSRTQSFEDYVSLLQSDPRYAAALDTGSNVHAFASALQRGGYATDPQYARKVSAIASDVASTLQGPGAASRTPDVSAGPLKLASAGPITAGADTLL